MLEDDCLDTLLYHHFDNRENPFQSKLMGSFDSLKGQLSRDHMKFTLLGEEIGSIGDFKVLAN